MSSRMELSREHLEQIGGYVKEQLPAWLRELSPAEPVRTDPQLLERIVRVEEELKSQRELMKQGFDQMEKRFEHVDKRFEQVDKRFEEQRGDMNQRFSMMFRFMSIGFIALAALMSVYEFIS